MKKYILLLSVSLLALHIVYGQETRKEYRVKYLEDSIKKEIRDKDKFRISISKNDTTFTYIPKQWGTMPKSDKKTTPKLKTTKSISSYELSFIPSTFIIDYSKDIGEIDIVENENTRGSLSYSVPIYSYSNFNVNSPPVSLVYNSMAGNGIAGKGWLISGLSAITITNNTIYHDSRTESGKRNRNSAFSLDGSRLINLNTGTSTTINYQTEFGNVSVTAYLVNNEIAYFTVRKPDGTVGTYGYTNNTMTNDCYPLTEIVDKQGSYATFNYSNINNIYFINSIYYGGKKNTASGHFAWLTFTYETRPDVETTYVDGLECKLDKRVTEISSYVNSQLLRTYAFSYENKRVSLLKRIDCKNGTKYLNPIYFYYGKNNQITQFVKTNTILTSYFSNSLPKDIRFQKANFNTYLNSDALVAYPDINTYDVVATKYIGNTPIAYQYGTRFHQDQTLLIYDDVSSSLSIPASITAGNGFLRLFPIDIDGDGIDELVKMNYHFPNSTTERITFTVYDVVNSLGTAILLQRYFFTGDYGGVVNWEGLLSPAMRTYLLGDFLGNGKTNILSISYNKNIKNEAVSSWATLVDIYGRQNPLHMIRYALILNRMTMYPRLILMETARPIYAISELPRQKYIRLIQAAV